MTLTDSLRFPEWVDPERWENSQQSVFEEVVARFDEGNRIVLLDNPCGGGKSLLAYMVHQAVSESSYYLVGTKGLQDQIERTLGLPVIKGRANYIPNGVDNPTGHYTEPTCSDCDYDNRTDMCSYCTKPAFCPYSSAKELAAMHPLPCANYSYALGEWTSPRSTFRDRQLVICDESDTIIDQLKSFVSVDISPRMQQRLHLSPPARKTVESAWEEWFDYAIPHISAERTKIIGKTLENRRLRERYARLLDKLTFISENLEGWVYEYERDYISFKPVTVNMLANQYLWKHGEKFLLMTGSGGSPEQDMKDLGFEGAWAPVFAPSTFDKSRRPIYLCPSARMTKKTEVTEMPKMAQAFLATIDMYPDSKILVHTHSYALTKTLLNAYEDWYDDQGYDVSLSEGRRVFAYLSGEEKNIALAAFDKIENAVLLAPSLDRGYDNPDIDVCIITKVPSPYLGSKQVSKRLREYTDGEAWYANETIKSLVQMYGRVMRSEEDQGITIILDSMFPIFHGRWKRMFPKHVNEAIESNSAIRFQLRQRIRNQPSSFTATS
jgi:Rad3-related DNA helicase